MFGSARARLKPPVLMLVTDRRRCAGDLITAVAAAVAGGAGMVQLRERELPAGELLALARRLRGVTAGRAMLLINDRADVAVLCGADGVHLGEQGLPVGGVRAWLPGGMLVGRSVHGIEAARQAEQEGADYLLLGTLFATPSHPEARPEGVELVREVVSRVGTPVLGIGGIGVAQAEECLRAGAAGVAVVSAILQAKAPREAAAALRQALDMAYDPDHGKWAEAGRGRGDLAG